ncbi:tRNA-5-carboxymethylaminomethyl-2-thiouridine(34)synthesis protein MnmE [Bathymodiolus thermophilus thioautotrophic gill symbiont]|uniref:tRNA modification GTPase MnmE n=1 Tax=Bathymodiolus thermophilus thioautotrophic gill symbiont TaxID=2360 RepID=A0A1J5U6S5_9GAMM|nr:tRNA uridine-5-carboxymethylaminomethyl(34) synthesis GTPase MnmE [Bathymodiolus thermophilus thioautotrophic gill symbiont]OIR24510.1 tRNA uridine-5-carboxymethylaminomethyl(34) synthesis GTPase MnmE [Bathymodiolus thermophilus thioautotrophic gill symbiont]CAB5493893.1 tRNA-5-carboxymethylaminomethyl-2-thiouridine(34)synthesis protein MnmE [Bathymodiolus thermophilus thioautotrophic gill symbiont]
MNNTTTICALASALGQGGIGVVRVSGMLAGEIAQKMLGKIPQARYAHYGSFFHQDGYEIDKGVALFFPAPHSFTGEDVLELQGHGGMVVMRLLLETSMSLGAVAAEPGEFSKRAFLNGKMDLVQAEAVADIIDASSQQSARSALRSLSGEFSDQVNALTQALIELRVFVEATIDFSDEEIDFLASGEVKQKIEQIEQDIQVILGAAQQGAILREGLNVAIAGKPNAGKSSLLNALTQVPSAIVTDIAGTTRDVLKETIHIHGMPLNIIDTAGLRTSEDKVEQEGIKRAYSEIEQADVVLLVFDAQDKVPDFSILPSGIEGKPILLIKNKVDLTSDVVGVVHLECHTQLSICAKHSKGIDLLRQKLAEIAGLSDTGEGVLLARKRHIIALESALTAVRDALAQLDNSAVELLAQELRQAAQDLGSITGEFSSDDLLGEIFSSFCIGK